MKYDYENNQLPEPKSTIFHVDMNAYFASVEQACNKFIQGKPVAVVSSIEYNGASILARSYEAKALGVKTFSRVFEAKKVCPELVCVPLDHLKYYDINTRIHKILSRYTEKIEVYSIDEFFLDMTDYFELRSVSKKELALEIKQRIANEIHPVLKCSIGVGANKLLAKVGSDFQKPDGLTIIPWDSRFEFLDSMELEDIWGIGWHTAPKLRQLGIKGLRDIRKLNRDLLWNLVGSYWARLVQLANGEHYDQVKISVQEKPQKTMQHAHTMSEATSDLTKLKPLVRKLSEKLATRLRKERQLAGEVNFGVRPSGQKDYGWGRLPHFSGRIKLDQPTNHGLTIYQTACKILGTFPLDQFEARLLVVGVGNLQETEQMRLLDPVPTKLVKLDQAIDIVNAKYGEFTMRSGDILHERAKERELSTKRLAMTFHPH